jgi:hypothetical protein
MKMKKTLITILFFLSIDNLYSQNVVYSLDCSDTICYLTDRQRYDSLISKTKKEFVGKFINKFYKNREDYIDFDNNKLVKLSTIVRNEDKLHFVMGSKTEKAEIIIETKLERKTIFNPKYIKKKKGGVIISYLALEKKDFILDTSINYGNRAFEPKSLYRYINSIKLIHKKDTINVPQNLLNDFVFPNLLYQYQGCAPIYAYYNIEKEYYCVYIYENTNIYHYDCYSDASAYLVKIIIDPKNNIIDRYVMPSGYLLTYGICNCPDFWIF